jgi:hypothetical protein
MLGGLGYYTDHSIRQHTNGRVTSVILQATLGLDMKHTSKPGLETHDVSPYLLILVYDLQLSLSANHPTRASHLRVRYTHNCNVGIPCVAIASPKR